MSLAKILEQKVDKAAHNKIYNILRSKADILEAKLSCDKCGLESKAKISIPKEKVLCHVEEEISFSISTCCESHIDTVKAEIKKMRFA